MSQPTPRQVLYALVAGGFIVIVVVLVVGSSVAGLAPTWWTVTMSVLCLLVSIWGAFNWRKTLVLLTIGMGLLVVWTVGTLIAV